MNVAVDVGAEALSPVMARYFQRTWVRGEGHTVFDSEGRGYLDFACGLAVTVLGHAHPRVTEAITEQAGRLLHMCSGLGYMGPVSALAAAVADHLPDPLDSVFFSNSGAEAIDGTIKLARRATGRPGIVGFGSGFHGRTYGALSITTSNPNYRRGHEPLLPDVEIAPYPRAYRDFGGDETRAVSDCLAALDALLDARGASTVAAMVIEPVLGEGGYVPAPAAFLRGLRERADQHGILLILDEVQSGYGRTGSWWGFQESGIVPDVVCLAKAMANGLPLGAIVSSRALQERWGVGAHGSTFGGNPVACAAGLAVLEVIDQQGLVENAARCGVELLAGLTALQERDQRIGDVRGRGLMIGVEFVRDRSTREPDGDLGSAMIARCADLGLVLLTCGEHHNIVRWIAPLNVTSDEISQALSIFDEALATVPAD